MKNIPSEAVEARKEAGDDTIVTKAMITEAGRKFQGPPRYDN